MTESQDDGATLAALLDDDPVALYDEAPCGYVTMTPDGTIVRLNRTFADWLGYTPQVLAGRRLASLLTIGSQIYHETHVAPLLAMQGSVSEIAVDLRTVDGKVLPVLISARESRDSAGVVRLIRTVVFDATERRRYEAELLRERRRAESNAQAKTELLQWLSHDVRTPLGTIMNVAGLLEARDARDVEPLRVLRSAAEGLLALVNRVLEVERLESPEFSLQPEPFNLRATLGEVVRAGEASAAGRDVALTMEIDDRVPERVVGDRLAMEQVLRNLTENAVKFTPDGRVVVAVRVESRTPDAVALEFSVRDEGIGIPPDRLERILDPFTQGDTGISRQYGGSGLGLTICRRILALYGSRLRISSTVGAGSTFQFVLTLPLAE